ncbi:MAG: hypothetical protein Q8911_07555 [Bacillota bacterium]|nr:hypothetical protein [Bacillota bacterium]
MAAILIPFYGMIRDPQILLFTGTSCDFLLTGTFLAFGPLLAEIYPTEVRATGQGFAYSVGRGVSAFAAAIVGVLALSKGLGNGAYFYIGSFRRGMSGFGLLAGNQGQST